MQITFKTKVTSRTKFHEDGSKTYIDIVPVPLLNRQHCNMDQAHKHSKLGAVANTELFPGMLRLVAAEKGINGYIELNNPPEGVTIDNSGFLAIVTAEI